MPTPGGLLLWPGGFEQPVRTFVLLCFCFLFQLRMCWRGVAWCGVGVCFVVVLLFCCQTTYQTQIVCSCARVFVVVCMVVVDGLCV